MRVERQEPYQENNEESAQRDAVLRKWNEAEHSVNDVRAERVRVMKFGGSVLTSAENILLVAGHVVDTARSERVAVVVSALRGVTDRLYSVTRALRMRDVPDRPLRSRRKFLVCIFTSATNSMPAPSRNSSFASNSPSSPIELDLVVRRAGEGQSPAEMTDEVVSFGERWSARMFAAALRKLDAHAEALDAFEFIVTNGDREDPQPRLGESYPKIRESLHRLFRRGHHSRRNRLRRRHSRGPHHHSRPQQLRFFRRDCGLRARARTTSPSGPASTASSTPIRAAMPTPQFLARLSYEEALEHSRRGAKVVHPKAFDFLMQERIPLLVRNAARPERPGTWVGDAEPGAPR